jgi:polyphosphate kinase 2 (PPK2 family)
MLEIINLNQQIDKESYRQEIDRLQTNMRMLGYYLYNAQRPCVMVFEGWDAAGKGGAINRLTERLDPRGYVVHPISAPRGDDAEKHYLWRFWRRLPDKGNIAIFDRSWYGRVLVERVEGFAQEAEWRRAYQEIKDFEAQLAGFGTILFKFWLHVSKEEQLRRFEDRMNRPHKAWKLTDEDWRNRDKWDEYEQAVEDMLIKTSTPQAPWTVVAANDKNLARVQVLQTVVDGLSQALNVDLSPAAMAKLPPLAAPTPIPDWALAEAARLHIPVP